MVAPTNNVPAYTPPPASSTPPADTTQTQNTQNRPLPPTPLETATQQPTPLEVATGLDLGQIAANDPGNTLLASNTTATQPKPLLPNVTPAGQAKANADWERLRTPAPNAVGMMAFGANKEQVEAVLAQIKQDAAYNALGPQDKGANGRDSLWNKDAAGVTNGRDARDLRDSTQVDSYSLSPRRQTEDVPGKLLTALGTSVQFDGKGQSQYDTLIIDTHRLNQFPEQYLPQIADAKLDGRKVMLVASIGGSAAANNNSGDFDKERAVADRDLRMLDNSLKLLNAAGIDPSKIQVVAGQADTPRKPNQTPERTAFVNELRTNTAQTYNQILERNGLGGQKVDAKTGLPWGGDELASTAIARALPERSVRVIALDKDGKEINPGTVANYWENNNSTSRLINEALDKNNLRHAKPGEQADMTLYVVVDKSNGQIDYRGQPQSIRHRIENDIANNRASPSDTMIVDMRTNNGAFDNQILPRDKSGKVREDLLAVGAWGTGANSLGQTLATGKVFNVAPNAAAQRQMLIESVANDFVLRNHGGRNDMTASPINAALNAGGINMNEKFRLNPGEKEPKSRWDRAGAFATLDEGRRAQDLTNRSINQQLDSLFGSDVGDVTTNFQFNRVFEAQFQLKGGPLTENLTRGRL
jgi:hypothetical protein